MTGMAGLRATIYNTFLRRTSVFTTTCVVAGMLGTSVFFKTSDAVWKSINKGVRLFSCLRGVSMIVLSVLTFAYWRCVVRAEILGGGAPDAAAEGGGRRRLACVLTGRGSSCKGDLFWRCLLSGLVRRARTYLGLPRETERRTMSC